MHEPSDWIYTLIIIVPTQITSKLDRRGMRVVLFP